VARQTSIIDATEFVLRTVRASVGDTPRRVIVSVSGSTSLYLPGRIVQFRLANRPHVRPILNR
jgi:hypothetical protein